MMDARVNDCNTEVNTKQHEENMNGIGGNAERDVIGNKPSGFQRKEVLEPAECIIQTEPLKTDLSAPAMKTNPKVEGLEHRKEIVLVKSESGSNSTAKPTADLPSSIITQESPAVLDTNQYNEHSSNRRKTTTQQDFVSKGNVFISYSRSQHGLCLKIYEALKEEGFNVWIDEYRIAGDILQCIAEGIEHAPVFLMSISEQYYKSFYCRAEAEYAFELRKQIIPILMQENYKANNWLGFIKGTKLHVDFSTLSFDEAIKSLIRQIEAAVKSPEVSGNGPRNISAATEFVTTMARTLICPEHIKNWKPDDVVQWLNEEKLQIFKDSLGRFTGKTLWELYKLKFDHPIEYCQMIEPLLPNDIPHRPFYILTFNGAIESLFCSSKNSSKNSGIFWFGLVLIIILFLVVSGVLLMLMMN